MAKNKLFSRPIQNNRGRTKGRNIQVVDGKQIIHKPQLKYDPENFLPKIKTENK